ncbi:MAG TPA: hypothetical protein VNK95_01525 [Caldilineaceae bacterium]|nr:hypothetical protein [Caldilineaceae bacterium]
MGKTGYLLIGGLVGAAAAAVYSYLFAPARGTTFDSHYRSRWDWAVEEGNRAADAHERELRRQFELAKQGVGSGE